MKEYQYSRPDEVGPDASQRYSDQMEAEEEARDRQERYDDDQAPAKAKRARPANAGQTAPPGPRSESRNGHNWTVTDWGYATRNCAFGLQCECQRPVPAAAPQPAALLTTRQKRQPAGDVAVIGNGPCARIRKNGSARAQ